MCGNVLEYVIYTVQVDDAVKGFTLPASFRVEFKGERRRTQKSSYISTLRKASLNPSVTLKVLVLVLVV